MNTKVNWDEAFGELISREMDDRGLSTRDVCNNRRGKVSSTTVLKARDGMIPNAELVIEIALGIGIDPDRALRAAKKPFSYNPRRPNGEDVPLDDRPRRVSFRASRPSRTQASGYRAARASA